MEISDCSPAMLGHLSCWTSRHSTDFCSMSMAYQVICGFISICGFFIHGHDSQDNLRALSQAGDYTMEGKHVLRGRKKSTTYGFKSHSVHERVDMPRGLKIQSMGLIHLQIENIFLKLAVEPSGSLLYTCNAAYDQRGRFFKKTCAQRCHMG